METFFKNIREGKQIESDVFLKRGPLGRTVTGHICYLYHVGKLVEEVLMISLTCQCHLFNSCFIRWREEGRDKTPYIGGVEQESSIMTCVLFNTIQAVTSDTTISLLSVSSYQSQNITTTSNWAFSKVNVRASWKLPGSVIAKLWTKRHQKWRLVDVFDIILRVEYSVWVCYLLIYLYFLVFIIWERCNLLPGQRAVIKWAFILMYVIYIYFSNLG